MAVAMPGRAPAIRILDCAVDPLTMEQALAWCLDACRTGHRARILLTANASHVVEMRDNPALQQAADAADLVTADGMSLVWAGRFLGHKVPERVAGIDLLSNLLRLAPQNSLRVFLLGARPLVLERLIERCREKFPGLDIVGWCDGYFAPSEHEVVIRRVAESGADILLVAMPSPFKDIWCERHRDRFGVKLVMGVGGAFDVLAGMVPRAPRWMHATGLEWAWRLMLEPRRLWRRYLVGNCRFIWLVFRERLRGRPSTVERRAGAAPAGDPFLDSSSQDAHSDCSTESSCGNRF
jgi:N-acetylglucosaminyldiphosphoundecaprenol N-acetyl-beta-D-mannosaminyltransferase